MKPSIIVMKTSTVEKIFVNWHLARFTWVNVALTTPAASAKNLVDECIEVQNLRLVCVGWSKKIENWFKRCWNIKSGWKNLPSVKSFPVYDFRSLPKEQHTLQTIAREFLFSWFGANEEEFCILQSRPDRENQVYGEKGRYDSYSTDKLFVNQTPIMVTMSFEYCACGHPNTRGELDNTYDVEIEGDLCTTFGEGARCWTKNPRAHEKLELGDFLRMTNYPANEMYKTDNDDERVCVKMGNYEKPFSFKKQRVVRYDTSHIYKYHINSAVLTLLCISKYSEDCWISELPAEIILMIVKSVKILLPFEETYNWRNGQTSIHKYRDVENDPWRRLLHI
jgi:hypothetical protein